MLSTVFDPGMSSADIITGSSMSALNVLLGRMASTHLRSSGSQYPPRSTGAPWHSSTSSATMAASFALSAAAKGLNAGNDRATASAHHMAT